MGKLMQKANFNNPHAGLFKHHTTSPCEGQSICTKLAGEPRPLVFYSARFVHAIMG